MCDWFVGPGRIVMVQAAHKFHKLLFAARGLRPASLQAGTSANGVRPNSTFARWPVAICDSWVGSPLLGALVDGNAMDTSELAGYLVNHGSVARSSADARRRWSWRRL